MHIDYITVHCSASPQNRGDTAATIHAWHREQGWDGIGYHYVILEDGTIEKGRPDYWRGAHVKGHNDANLGICLIGYGNDATNEQLDALRQLVRGLLHQHTSASLKGHNNFDLDRECPGFDVVEWYYTRSSV